MSKKVTTKTIKYTEFTGMEIPVKIKKLNEDAVIPKYAISNDACMDVVATSLEYDAKIDAYVYHTGLSFALPDGYEMQIRPRSSNRKTDAYLANAPGTLDAGYNGELMVVYKNRTATKVNKLIETLKDIYRNYNTNCTQLYRDIINIDSTSDTELNYAPYQVGDRVAQIKVVMCPRVKWEEVEKLEETERGSNCFGSTGN